MARWITVTEPFEYRWPDRSAVTVFREEHLGEHFVKDDLAEHAIAIKAAKDGKAKGSKARSVKSGPKAVRAARQPRAARSTVPKASKVSNALIDATAANLQPDNRLDGARLSDDGGAAHGRAVDTGAS